MTQTLTCSAHSGLQAGVATRARRMRLEAPASPLALSRTQESEVALLPLPLGEQLCLKSSLFQALAGCGYAACQGLPDLMTALMIVSNLCMQAVRATFLGLPARTRR